MASNIRGRLDLSTMTDEEIEDFLNLDGDDLNTDGEADDTDDSLDDLIPITQSGDFVEEAIATSYGRLLFSTSAAAIVGEPQQEAVADIVEAAPPGQPQVTPFRTRLGKRSRSVEAQREEGGPVIPSSGVFTGDVLGIRNGSAELKKIVWRGKSMQLHKNEVLFRGDSEIPTELAALETPYDFFMYFLTEDLLKKIADETNLYARQQDITTKFSTNANEMRKFIGILMFMAIYHYPNVRSYWGMHSLEYVRKTMPVLRFEEIRRFIHFADTSHVAKKNEPGFDQLCKIRPIIDHFNERFGSVPKLPRLCVDEQMCATKMTGAAFRQYMPNKPHKWGFKLFVLCDSNGFSYAFEVYTGAGDNVLTEGAPDLGASSNVVIRLTKNVPDNVNHILYFDNFYTSLGLLVYLQSRGIYALGTVRANRVTNCKLSTDKQLAAKPKEQVPRGYSEEYVGSAYGVDISTVLWNDTKTVRLASTYVGIKEFRTRVPAMPRLITRWDKSDKRFHEIDCPNIIKEYNCHMGGVDLMDGLLGRYHIKMKTRKWTCRIFYHLLDVAMVNAYILYHRVKRHDKIELPVFRTSVAETLCTYGAVLSQKKQVGRPSNTSQLSPKVSPKRVYIPPVDTRYDKIDHWCIFRDRTGKKTCKYPGCKSETQSFCTKCNISLCYSPIKSCFYDFHNKN